MQNRTVFNANQAPDALHLQLKQSMETYLEESMGKRDAPPGMAICIVKDGKIVLLRGFGNRHVDDADPVDSHTAFRLASLSKSFAALLTSVLVQEGYLSWDDRVKKHWPDFALKNHAAADSMRIRHILSQSTGLPRHAFTNLIEEGYTHEALIQSLQEIESIAMPGTVYSYQNVAYSLIESVVQSITGQTYEALLRDRVFGPLFMNDASTSLDDLKRKANYATPHLPTVRGWKAVKLSDRYYNVVSAGGVNASASDMAKYLIALTTGTPAFEAEGHDVLFRPEMQSFIRYKYFSKWPNVHKVYYGLGWRIVDFGGHRPRVAYHGGYVAGFRSSMAVIPEENAAICVLTNSSSGFADDCVHHFIGQYSAISRYVPLTSGPSLPVKMWFWPA